MNVANRTAEGRVALPDYAHPWISDRGDGTYQNPILYADYSDPDVLRVGDEFYLTASSFNCTPGLPILRSTDLVNWTLVGHALRNLPHPRYEQVQPGCGVWAPSLRFHAGRFWIFFPMPDEGLYVTTATDPCGQWSEPLLVQAGRGLIDPCPLWDDDGNAYLVHAYAHSRSGLKHRLRVAPMSPDGARLLGDGHIVFHKPELHPTIEGPKFLKRDGWYYILAPAGGVQAGWQTVLRSRSIYGPYEDRVVLQQGQTPINGPHQGALVDTPTGEWWFIHFQDAGVYGRIVHLQPVEWRDGWPLMGVLNGGVTAGEPVLRHPKPNLPAARRATPATSDEFSSSAIALQWQWNANHREAWYSLVERAGWLRLFAQRFRNLALERVPNLLLQKFPARVFACETLLDVSGAALGDEAGLVVQGRVSAALAVRRVEHGAEIVSRVGPDRILGVIPDHVVRLRVAVREGGLCTFQFARTSGEWLSAGVDFQAQAGVWIGAKVGLYCLAGEGARTSGYADFDWFRLVALQPE